MASLKGNIILNYINTLSGLIFPIVTYPYAARVLLPEGIGVVNFQNSIIHYIVLLTSLGLPLYATREVARCRNDRDLLNQTTIEIVLLSVILCFIGYVGVFLIGEFVPRVNQDLSLFYILSLSIIFTGVGVSWFYQGIEDFLFITGRGLIVRIASAVSLFVFVKSKEDILIYALVIVGSTVGNNLINFIHLRKYIDLKKIEWRQLHLIRHIKPAFQAFLISVIASIYLVLNTIVLGFMTDNETVGLFTSGTKITHILIVILASLSSVLLPRCSHLIGEGKIDQFNELMKKSYYLLMFSAIPISLGCLLISRPMTLCFCGENYEGSISVVMWTAPTVLFAGLSNLICFQILYPYGKDKIFTFSTFVGALISLVLNFILIPILGANGAAIATFSAELWIVVSLSYLGRKFIPFSFIDKQVGTYLLAVILMTIGIFPCYMIQNIWIQMICMIILGSSIYILVLYLRKDIILKEVLTTLRIKGK